MKTAEWTRLVLASIASALMIVPVINIASAIADDNVTNSEVREPVQPANSDEIADEPRTDHMDRQAVDRKQSPSLVVGTGPDHPADRAAVGMPRSGCVLVSIGSGWLMPTFDCS